VFHCTSFRRRSSNEYSLYLSSLFKHVGVIMIYKYLVTYNLHARGLQNKDFVVVVFKDFINIVVVK